MNPEQQRIAIAEACGWRIVHKTKYKWVVICPSNIERAWSRRDGVMNDKPASYYLPDYLNDLNAMHDAEKVLDYNQLRDMEDSVSFQFAVYPFHATASQRAESFLRTLSLWQVGG